MRKVGAIATALAVVGVLSVGRAASAAPTPITVPGYSFEDPRVQGNPFGLPVVLNPTSWHTAGPGTQVTFDGVHYYNPNTGIFANARTSGGTFFSNADDGTSNGPANQANAQLAYIFSDTGEEFQQTLTSNFQAGQTYALTIAAANAGTAPPPTDKLFVSLFYTDPGADPTVAANRHFLATTTAVSSTLPYSSSDTPGAPTVSLVDITTNTNVLNAGNSALGRPINVLISTGGTGGGEFDFDNVRLTSDTPEPASLGLLGAGAVALLARRRRGAAR